MQYSCSDNPIVEDMLFQGWSLYLGWSYLNQVCCKLDLLQAYKKNPSSNIMMPHQNHNQGTNTKSSNFKEKQD